MTLKDNKKFKTQTISITLGSIIGSIFNGIVGYIAVYFFKPLWEKFIRWWNDK